VFFATGVIPLMMSSLPHLLRSLTLTAIFSFLAPVLLIGAIAASLTLISYVPRGEIIGQTSITQVSYFLSIFGNGSVFRGVFVIGMVCSLVGVLFDTYTFYREQNFRDS
jgi:hypothetical protein